jgi:hypothetical protein
MESPSQAGDDLMTRPFELRWDAFRSHGCFEPNLRHLQEYVPFTVGLGSFRPVQTLVREVSKFVRRQDTPLMADLYGPLTIAIKPSL